ncbi:MAG: cupin [Spirochaeta sp.]|nr:cupin [Spirochaeta sp.]
MRNAEYWISRLDLQPHPEGGYFKEIYTSPFFVNEKRLSTSIYFLLSGNEVSKFHRLASDELWYYHDGSSLAIHMINPEGEHIRSFLGMNVEKGELPQVIVRAGAIFGSELTDKSTYSLVGCLASPGFTYEDFKLYSEQELLSLYPQHRTIIERLT